MWIARGGSIGLAVASFAIVGVVLAPQQGWADGGKGPTPDIIYSDEEDEDEIETLEATPESESSGYSAPESFDLSFRPKFNFSTGLNLGVDYTAGTVKAEESTAESTVYTTKYSYSGNILVRPEYRYRWRFPESDYVDDDDGEEEPASTPSLPKLKYKFSTWVSFETLEVLDEEEESGSSFGLRPNLTDEQRDNIDRAFEMFVRKNARERVAKWLGDGVAEDFQKRFGLAADDAGAEDQSGWSGTHIYCGGTCVGHYY